MWEEQSDIHTSPATSMATYTNAVRELTASATAFMEHVHLLAQARAAYEKAMSASAELRSCLDSGDQALRSLMLELKQAINGNLGDSVVDRKQPEPVVEAALAARASTGTFDMPH